MLSAISLIKVKGYKILDFRSWTNGIKQKRYFKNGEIISSPIVSLKSIFSAMVIDLYEVHDVNPFGVPGAYLHADLPK